MYRHVIKALAICWSLLTLAAPGDLNPEFGEGAGYITQVFGTEWIIGSSIALKGTGKIVVGGYASFLAAPNKSQAFVAQLLSSGALDTDFGGGNGYVATEFAHDGYFQSVAIQADGKILLSGEIRDSEGGAVGGVIRYNADGSLDTTFGAPNGYIEFVAWLGGTSSIVTRLYSVHAQDDGSIIAAGSTYIAFAWYGVVAKFAADGSLDTTFGDPDGMGARKGYAVTAAAGGYEPPSLAVLPDGKILTGGVSGANLFTVVRYTADGTLDTTFAAPNGYVTTAVGQGVRNYAEEPLVVQEDGKILIGGTASLDGVNECFAIARYNIDGTLDTVGFGAPNGYITTFLGQSTALLYGLALQTDGKILAGGAAGGADQQFTLARFNTDGTLDTTFGNPNGYVISTFDAAGRSFGYARGLAVQTTGNILATGGFYDYTLAQEPLLVANYLSGAGGSCPVPPVAQDGTATTQADVPVLLNLRATTGESVLLDFGLTRLPQHGSLSSFTQPVVTGATQAATVLYTPAAGYAGDDSVRFIATGTGAESNAATVTITVDPSPYTTPVAQSGTAQTPENKAQFITLTATNADGSIVTFSTVAGPAHGALAPITQPTVGGTTQQATVLYTPVNGYSGVDSFTFKATNNTAISNTATITLQIDAVPTQDTTSVDIVNKYWSRLQG